MKRALLVNKRATKRSKKIKLGDEVDATKDFTKRVLLSLIVDVTELRETAERLHIQVFTLARANGIKIPDED